MKRSIRSLAVIARITPTLGLLGTVYGMIAAFQKTSEGDGAAKPAELANGIYEALITTAAGLTIAIPVVLLYQFLISRVDSLIDHIDEVGTEFTPLHAAHRPRRPPVSSCTPPPSASYAQCVGRDQITAICSQ